MNRRGFLGMLGAAIAGATLDPEKLIWEPGKKLISIPAVTTSYEEMWTVTMEEFSYRYIEPAIRQIADQIDREFNKDLVFLSDTRWSSKDVAGRPYRPINRLKEVFA